MDTTALKSQVNEFLTELKEEESARKRLHNLYEAQNPSGSVLSLEDAQERVRLIENAEVLMAEENQGVREAQEAQENCLRAIAALIPNAIQDTWISVPTYDGINYYVGTYGINVRGRGVESFAVIVPETAAKAKPSQHKGKFRFSLNFMSLILALLPLLGLLGL